MFLQLSPIFTYSIYALQSQTCPTYIVIALEMIHMPVFSFVAFILGSVLELVRDRYSTITWIGLGFVVLRLCFTRMHFSVLVAYKYTKREIKHQTAVKKKVSIPHQCSFLIRPCLLQLTMGVTITLYGLPLYLQRQASEVSQTTPHWLIHLPLYGYCKVGKYSSRHTVCKPGQEL